MIAQALALHLEPPYTEVRGREARLPLLELLDLLRARGCAVPPVRPPQTRRRRHRARLESLWRSSWKHFHRDALPDGRAGAAGPPAREDGPPRGRARGSHRL